MKDPNEETVLKIHLNPANHKSLHPFELMQQYQRFQNDETKNQLNCYSAKPKGLVHRKLQESEEPSLSGFDNGGKDMQNSVVDTSQVRKRATKRQLHKEAMAASLQLKEQGRTFQATAELEAAVNLRVVMVSSMS